MKLTRTTFVLDASTDDAAAVCDQLAPSAWIVEAGYCPAPAHDPDCVPIWHELSAGVALSVCSNTALRLPLGLALIDWFSKKGYVLSPLASLALHELIVNAAIHGNLGVSSKNLNIWQDLSDREAVIADSRRDPLLCNRLVTVALGWTDDCLVVIISDEGDGYQTEDSATPNRGSGRGLRIARAAGDVQVRCSGRQTVLTLRYQHPDKVC
jgi:hypothetical protein